MDFFTAFGAALLAALAFAVMGTMCLSRPGRADHTGDAFSVIFTFSLIVGLLFYSPLLALCITFAVLGYCALF
jgi:hypothetical protein